MCIKREKKQHMKDKKWKDTSSSNIETTHDVTKPKDTQHKKYININVYQTNSPSKLVTSKTLFPLKWNSPPKSITPLEEWHSIFKFLPLFDTIVKGHKKPKDMTETNRKLT